MRLRDSPTVRRKSKQEGTEAEKPEQTETNRVTHDVALRSIENVERAHGGLELLGRVRRDHARNVRERGIYDRMIEHDGTRRVVRVDRCKHSARRCEVRPVFLEQPFDLSRSGRRGKDCNGFEIGHE
ncbi:MAG TPA: hypothetical protein VN876_04480 [Gemmatimonadaceae bacterium]|nr:hypothetical protein [Gemmatimonadaceae bacterium]